MVHHQSPALVADLHDDRPERIRYPLRMGSTDCHAPRSHQRCCRDRRRADLLDRCGGGSSERSHGVPVPVERRRRRRRLRQVRPRPARGSAGRVRVFTLAAIADGVAVGIWTSDAGAVARNCPARTQSEWSEMRPSIPASDAQRVMIARITRELRRASQGA